MQNAEFFIPVMLRHLEDNVTTSKQKCWNYTFSDVAISLSFCHDMTKSRSPKIRVFNHFFAQF